MLTPLELTPSFGFGDHIGLATLGHIAAVKGTKFAPVFAQQSVRENVRTRRTRRGFISSYHELIQVIREDFMLPTRMSSKSKLTPPDESC